jgi:hypothetical protein
MLIVLLSAATGAAGALHAPVARAVEPYGNSLDWVPSDASVYSASLRLKEQVDAVAASKAWQRFREIPAVAQAWMMVEMQINNPAGPAAMFWQIMALPENKQMAQVLGEMVSDEIVFYAGEDFIKLVELYQLINGSTASQLLVAIEEARAAASGQAGAVQDPNAARIPAIMQAIKDDPALLDVPELVFAFRIKDKNAAQTQLARLEILANMLLDQTGLGSKFERREFHDTEFLVLFLEGTMIPLPDQMPYGLNLDEDDYQKLRQIIREKELYVCLGLWNDYVVLSFNKSTEHLAALGQGPAIGARKELAPLARFRDRKLSSVGYASREVVASQLIQSADLDEMVKEIDAFIRSSPSISDDLRERIGADLREAANDFRKYLPVAGPAASFGFLTDGGFESFAYSWTQQPGLESGKPLEIAQHMGGSPILGFAARGVDDPHAYDTLVKWIRKFYGYVENVGLAEMEEGDREKFQQAMDVARPLLARFDAVTREKLVPALADGQSAIVLDADIASKQWHADMPASFEPLPMFELGIVVGVSDREKLVAAMSDYRALINDAIDAVRQQNPDDVPEGVEFPAPEEIAVSDGTLYAWNLNPELGLDPQVVPCAAVNDHAAVLASSRALAERALAVDPLEGATALGDADAPRAMIVRFGWADLVSAAEPWVTFAIRQELAGEAAAAQDPANDPAEVEDICRQVTTGLSILKCFRGVWAESRREDDAWVTHSVLVVEDLDD